MADHIASLERQTGRTLRPETPDLPFAFRHIWQWFVEELTPRRSSNGFGVNPLTHAEVEAWARLTGRTPTTMEARLLMRLDTVVVAALRPKPST